MMSATNIVKVKIVKRTLHGDATKSILDYGPTTKFSPFNFDLSVLPDTQIAIKVKTTTFIDKCVVTLDDD